MNITNILIILLSKLTQQNLVCPFYHTISDTHLPHIQNLYSVQSVKKFKSDIDTYLKLYQPIDLQSLIDIVVHKQPIKKRIFFLSFDDGLREVYDVIYPILKQKGIPATIFLNSAFIDNKELFYRYKVSLLIDNLTNENTKILAQEFNLNATKYEVKNFLLALNYSQQEHINSIAKILNIDFNDFLLQKKPYLTTIQIK